MVKLALDRLQVVEDVRVVEFEVVQDQRTRVVMDELGSLVEQRRIVLVCLDHEKRGFAEPRGARKIAPDAADQETGFEPGILENPGQHAAGRGLAVGSGDGQHPALLQHVFVQPLRAGGVARTALEDGFELRIAAGDRIADDEYVGIVGQGFGPVAVVQVDTGAFELGAHRRIDLRVGAGDLATEFARDLCNTGHEGAADAENINFHRKNITSSIRFSTK